MPRRLTRSTLFPYTTLFRSVHCALPGEGCRSLVVARSGVVVEAVLRARIGEHLVSHAVGLEGGLECQPREIREDRKSTRLNSSHVEISYAVFCLKKKKKIMF